MTREELIKQNSELLELEKDGSISIDTILTIPEEENKKYRVEQELVRKKIYEKNKRDAMLKIGTTTQDGKLWFNLETAQMFVSGVSTLDDGESFLWRDVNREVVEISYADAKAYIKEIRIVLQKFYGFVR